jgi:hypothetical protein
MAKNRNKKNRAKSGGLAAMDISEGGPATSTAADVPQRTSPLSFSFIFVRVFFFCVRRLLASTMARFRVFCSLPGSNGHVRGKAAIVGHSGARFDQQVS